MTPEEKARQVIDAKLRQSGWVIQDFAKVNLTVSLGVAVREFPTSTGPVDYALFIDGMPVGVVEAKRDDMGENITTVEKQSSRYANSTFKYVPGTLRIRFVYEATGELTRFTDYADIKYRSRAVFTFHRPETLKEALNKSPHLSWRQIFRPASLKNLEIHQVFLRFFASRCMKICSPIHAR